MYKRQQGLLHVRQIICFKVNYCIYTHNVTTLCLFQSNSCEAAFAKATSLHASVCSKEFIQVILKYGNAEHALVDHGRSLAHLS